MTGRQYIYLMNRTRFFSLSIASLCTLTFAGCAERTRTWQKASTYPGSTEVVASVKIKRGCGYARSGDEAYVVNHLPDHRVKLTVQKWSPEIDHAEYTHMILEPSEAAALGCTTSRESEHPRYQFWVTRCSIVGGGHYVSDGKTVVD